jgi:hypothetical protein
VALVPAVDACRGALLEGVGLTRGWLRVRAGALAGWLPRSRLALTSTLRLVSERGRLLGEWPLDPRLRFLAASADGRLLLFERLETAHGGRGGGPRSAPIAFAPPAGTFLVPPPEPAVRLHAKVARWLAESLIGETVRLFLLDETRVFILRPSRNELQAVDLETGSLLRTVPFGIARHAARGWPSRLARVGDHVVAAGFGTGGEFPVLALNLRTGTSRRLAEWGNILELTKDRLAVYTESGGQPATLVFEGRTGRVRPEPVPVLAAAAAEHAVYPTGVRGRYAVLAVPGCARAGVPAVGGGSQ